MSSPKNLSPVERIKLASDGLRGTLKESLTDPLSGALYEADQSLIKFHGMYQQDDRDRRIARTEKKLEWLYSFMIRLRLPGGLLSASQYAGLHHIAGTNTTGVIKITTRQTVQLHGLLKAALKPTLKAFNTLELDSIAACGDVNRNVLCSANPYQSPLHQTIFSYAEKISLLALPKTRAYYEIWLDEAPLADRKIEADPLYQEHYLPRKFKIAIAIPPNNDIDVYANDIGLIAVVENNQLQGFNLVAGGGLSATHGNPNTYARLASPLGFVSGEINLLKVVYEIISIQRDFGNRSDRKLARLKYTIDKMGIPQFKKELESRCGFPLQPLKPYQFTAREDYYGWQQDTRGNWHYTLFVENGRITDSPTLALKTGLFEIAKLDRCNFRFTANQNLILADIEPGNKAAIQQLLSQFALDTHTEKATPIRKNAIACVAFNTCPLALAEAQRYLPDLLNKVEPLLKKYELQDEPISIRMTGCPNGCGRSPLAEIGLIGTAYGRYNLYLGGDHLGERLNRLYKEHLDETAILEELDSLFASFKQQAQPGERFGNFTHRWLKK